MPGRRSTPRSARSGNVPTAIASAEVDGRRDRWRAHREARRAELIRAVMDTVAERGPDIGMDDVAAVSGIAKPVFYRYFADKADLFLAAGRRIAEEAVDEVTAAIDDQSSPHAMVAAGIDAFLHRIEAHPEHYRFASRSAALGRQPGADPVGDFASVVGLHATRVIAEFLRRAQLDAGAAEPWGFGLVGLVKTAADRWLEQPTISRAALGDYLTDLLWSGLGRPRQVRSLPGAGKGQQLRVVAGGDDVAADISRRRLPTGTTKGET